MLTENELTLFLNSTVQPSNFTIFAALSNLESRENYMKVIELLYFSEITLFDLSNLAVIDDISIDEFLKNYYRYNSPYINDTLVPLHTVNSTLLANDSILKGFLNVFNQNANTVYTNTAERKRSNLYYVEFGNGTVYSSLSNLINDFNLKVLNPFLQSKGVADISTLFPNLTVPSNFPAVIKPLFQALIDKTLKPFKDKFTNNNLMEIFIWNPELPSINANQVAVLNGMLNLVEFSTVVRDNLQVDLIKISSRTSATYNAEELNAEWANLASTDLDSVDLTELLAYIRYKIALNNTLEQKHNGNIKTGLDDWVLDLISKLKVYTELHIEVEKLIASRMYVQTI